MFLLPLLLLGLPLRIAAQRPIPGNPPLRYVSVGKGPALIVLLHGGPGATHDYLRPEWDRLAALGQVVYYDQRGCGMNPDTSDYGWRDHVADLDRLVRTLRRGRKLVLAGSSWGSELALRYAYVHPGTVDAIVLSGFVGWPSDALLAAVVQGRVGPQSTLLGLSASGRPSVIHVRPSDRFQPDLGRIDLHVSWSILPDSTPPDVPPPADAFPGKRDLFPVPVGHDSATYDALRQEYIRRAAARRGWGVQRRSGGPGAGEPRSYAMAPEAVAGDSALAWRFPEMCDEAGTRTGLSRTSPVLDSLRSVRVPTLAFSGGRIPGQRQGDGVAQLVGVLPNLVVDTIAAGGHDPWHARPDEFFARVLAFLRPIVAIDRR